MLTNEDEDDFKDEKEAVEVILQAFTDIGNALKTVTGALTGAWRDKKETNEPDDEN